MPPRAAALLLALAATLLAACGHSAGDGSQRLVVDAPRWWFSHLPVAVGVTPAAQLAARDVSVTVSVGSNVAGRWELKKKPARLWLPAGEFALGPNQVAVKTGSERTVAAVAIVSIGWLLALVALVAALAGAFVARWRRRRVDA